MCAGGKCSFQEMRSFHPDRAEWNDLFSKVRHIEIEILLIVKSKNNKVQLFCFLLLYMSCFISYFQKKTLYARSGPEIVHTG